MEFIAVLFHQDPVDFSSSQRLIRVVIKDFCSGFNTITSISELRCRYSALTVADIDEDNHLVLLLVVQHSYIVPDIIVQDGTTFIDDANIFDSGYVAGLE